MPNLFLIFNSWFILKKKTLILANIICFISAISSIPKSHIYIVTIFANLNIEYDNSGLDESLSIKEVLAILYWKNFNKIINIKF